MDIIWTREKLYQSTEEARAKYIAQLEAMLDEDLDSLKKLVIIKQLAMANGYVKGRIINNNEARKWWFEVFKQSNVLQEQMIAVVELANLFRFCSNDEAANDWLNIRLIIETIRSVKRDKLKIQEEQPYIKYCYTQSSAIVMQLLSEVVVSDPLIRFIQLCVLAAFNQPELKVYEHYIEEAHKAWDDIEAKDKVDPFMIDWWACLEVWTVYCRIRKLICGIETINESAISSARIDICQLIQIHQDYGLEQRIVDVYIHAAVFEAFAAKNAERARYFIQEAKKTKVPYVKDFGLSIEAMCEVLEGKENLNAALLTGIEAKNKSWWNLTAARGAALFELLGERYQGEELKSVMVKVKLPDQFYEELPLEVVRIVQGICS